MGLITMMHAKTVATTGATYFAHSWNQVFSKTKPIESPRITPALIMASDFHHCESATNIWDPVIRAMFRI